MEIFLWGVIALIFSYINLSIILSDIKDKKIPNSYILKLLYLLPFWYIYGYYYSFFWDITLLSSFLQIFVAFVICFLLFHYGLWWAGDAKYLLVLCLFIPHMSIISVIGSIAFVTILYLLWYFIWFWTWKNILNKNAQVYKILWQVKKKEITQEKSTLWNKKFYKKLIFWAALFLVFFGSIRLIRIYIIEHIARSFGVTPREILEYILLSDIDIFLLGIAGITIVVMLFMLSRVAYLYFQEKIGYNLQMALLTVVCIWLIPFLYESFREDPEWLKTRIMLIFTLYIWIYFSIKALLAWYKVVFNSQEEENIHINNLQAGTIIDRRDLMKNFGYQEILDNFVEENTPAKKMLQKIRNPLSQEDVQLIQKIYATVKNHHTKEKTPGYFEMQTVRTIKVFALSPYILLWFSIAFIDIPGKISEIISRFLLNL